MSHIPRILVDGPLSVGERVSLPGDKAHHLNTVLRLGEGARLRLFNGDGSEYAAAVARAARDGVEVAIDAADTPQREPPLRLTLAQAIARGDRMDLAIAKAVELGVDTVQPLFCRRGKVKLAADRLQKKQAHWQRVAESAAEQSGRLVRPRVSPAMDCNQFLDSPPHGLRLMLAPQATTRLSALARTREVALLVGPESGFDRTEIARAEDAGCQPLQLGPRTLRTETAGMAALAAIQSLWGDLG